MTNLTKTNFLYWILLIVVFLLALLLLLSFWGVDVVVSPETERDVSVREERLQRLQELRAGSTVTPSSREDRLDRLDSLRQGG